MTTHRVKRAWDIWTYTARSRSGPGSWRFLAGCCVVGEFQGKKKARLPPFPLERYDENDGTWRPSATGLLMQVAVQAVFTLRADSQ